MEIRSHSSVELIQQVGNDAMIAAAARVSTALDIQKRYISPSEEADAKLINYLVSNKHGSPFEHGLMTFRIETPIFVVREFHRHRIGWSYNEMSGRYTELRNRFYIPDMNRPLTQEGSSAHPKLGITGEESPTKYGVVEGQLTQSYMRAWDAYQKQLDAGTAKEVARMCLPVGIFTEMYATANPRSIMNFLNLRLAGNAQYEIRMVAQQIERIFAQAWPATYASWVENDRVAP